MRISRPYQPSMDRRHFLVGGAAAAGLLGGCSGPAAERPLVMIVYRDPSCGCCAQWAALANQAGFQAAVVDRTDMAQLKERLGVPEELASCHTAIVNDFVIEGHVPFQSVRRLLQERPAGVRGIAVAGMPAGSPGMEVPDGTREPFQIFSFDAAGRRAEF